jgi:hypothetical protein
MYYIFFLNHVDIGEVGVAYDPIAGKLTLQIQPGWYQTSCLTRVVKLSVLPTVIHLPSDAKVINTKIVRLVPEHADDFVKTQGFSYALKSGEENILMGYAFSGKSFNFLEILQEGGTVEK